MIERWDIEKLLKLQESKGELYSYQIIAILMALENFAGKNECGIRLYQSWIKSRNKRDPYVSTIDLAVLARSFEIHGFSDQFPLDVDPTDNLLSGGTHRTACAIFCNLDQVPVRRVRRTGPRADNPKYYGIDYFSNSSFFDKQEVRYLVKRWEAVKEKYELIK